MMANADTQTLLNHLQNQAADAQVAIYLRLSKRLAKAGAEYVAVTSIAGHFCVAAFEAELPLPLVNMISVVSRAINVRGLKRIGILGTRTVMETRFYGAIDRAEIILPNQPIWTMFTTPTIAMAASGVITPA